MNIQEFIIHLEKTKLVVGGEAPVILHYDHNDEIEVFGISVRAVDEGDFEVIIE